MKVWAEFVGWGTCAFAAALTITSALAHPDAPAPIVNPWAAQNDRGATELPVLGEGGEEPPHAANAPATADLAESNDGMTRAAAARPPAGGRGQSGSVGCAGLAGAGADPGGSEPGGADMISAGQPPKCLCPHASPPWPDAALLPRRGSFVSLMEVEDPWRRVSSGLAVDRTWREVPLLVDPWEHTKRRPMQVAELGLFVDPWAENLEQ